MDVEASERYFLCIYAPLSGVGLWPPVDSLREKPDGLFSGFQKAVNGFLYVITYIHARAYVSFIHERKNYL